MSALAKIHNKWLGPVARNPKAEISLFCFPYAGGSAALFSPWPRVLPNFVQVCPVQLPGRGNRHAEPPWRRIDQLADAIAEDLLPVFKEKPFVFFGYSMGASLAFEVAGRLSRRHKIEPQALLIAARRAPQIPLNDPPTHHLPEAEFVEELKRLKGTPAEVIEHRELMELMLPLLRADFEAVETYEYLPSAPLQCPFFVMGGTEDTDVPREFLEAWRTHTLSMCPVTMFPGDHFFLQSQAEMVLKFIAGILTDLMARTGRNRAPVQY
jgi:medium-chain acyl-[acyl-carrier-protein] hydrolase